MEDAVARYCAASESGDMAGLAETLAPDVRLPSPVIGRAVFKGRDDVVELLTAVYGMLRDVRWEQPIGEGSQRVAISQARVGGLFIGDTTVFELDSTGLIVRVRPHLRPLLATIVFFLMVGPRIAPRPGILLRAIRP
jgi:hypothetical protein